MDATLVQTMFNGGCGFALVQSSWILKNNSAVSMVRTIDFAECFLKNPEKLSPSSVSTMIPAANDTAPLLRRWHLWATVTCTRNSRGIVIQCAAVTWRTHVCLKNPHHLAYQTWSNYIKLCATSSMRLLAHGHPSIEWMGADHPTIQLNRKRPKGDHRGPVCPSDRDGGVCK